MVVPTDAFNGSSAKTQPVCSVSSSEFRTLPILSRSKSDIWWLPSQRRLILVVRLSGLSRMLTTPASSSVFTLIPFYLMLIPLKNRGSSPNSGGTLLATPTESQATPLQLFVEHTLFSRIIVSDLIIPIRGSHE